MTAESTQPPAPSLKRGLLTGGFWILLGKGLTVLCTLATEGLLARVLTKSEYGVYALAFSVVAFASIAAQMGLHHTVLRFVAESIGFGKPERARETILMVYRWALVSGAVVFGILAFGPGAYLVRHAWDAPELAASMGAIAVWTVVISFQVITSESFRGFKDLRFSALFGGVVTGLLNVFFLSLIYLGWGQTTLATVVRVVVIAASLSLGLGLLVLYRTKVHRLPSRPGAMTTGELFAVALPLWVVMLVNNAVTQADRWILATIVGKEELAVYSAAARLVVLVSQPLILINLLVPPYIAELYARGEKQRLERILRQMAALAGIPAIVVLLLFIFFGDTILTAVYTKEYAGGATILAILSIAKVANVLAGSSGITMAMTGHQNVLMRISLSTGLLTAVSSVLAAREWGALGVAIASSLGITLTFVFQWWATKRHTGMWTHPGLPTIAEVRKLLGGKLRR